MWLCLVREREEAAAASQTNFNPAQVVKMDLNGATLKKPQQVPQASGLQAMEAGHKAGAAGKKRELTEELLSLLELGFAEVHLEPSPAPP